MKIPRRLKEILSALSVTPEIHCEKRGFMLKHPNGNSQMAINLGLIQTPVQWAELETSLRQTFGRKK